MALFTLKLIGVRLIFETGVIRNGERKKISYREVHTFIPQFTFVKSIHCLSPILSQLDLNVLFPLWFKQMETV